MTVCRGIRGATTTLENTKEAIFDATQDLFRKLVQVNDIQESQVAATFFTTTPDLNSAFPATAVREMGWTNTALLCGHEDGGARRAAQMYPRPHSGQYRQGAPGVG